MTIDEAIGVVLDVISWGDIPEAAYGDSFWCTLKEALYRCKFIDGQKLIGTGDVSDDMFKNFDEKFGYVAGYNKGIGLAKTIGREE